jgi:hypothetical protein
VEARRKRLNVPPGTFATVVEGLLSDGIAVRFRAGGRSMTPTIEDGEVLIVAPAMSGQVDVADVVFCRTRAGAVAHRLLEIAPEAGGGSRLTLCGDASLETDHPVSESSVQGRVIGIERGGRRLDVAVRAGAWRRRAIVAALELRRALRRWRARRWLAPLAPARAPG